MIHHSDLTRPHPKWWFSKEIALFQGNLGWWNIIIWPDVFKVGESLHVVVFQHVFIVWISFYGNFMAPGKPFRPSRGVVNLSYEASCSAIDLPYHLPNLFWSWPESEFPPPPSPPKNWEVTFHKSLLQFKTQNWNKKFTQQRKQDGGTGFFADLCKWNFFGGSY